MYNFNLNHVIAKTMQKLARAHLTLRYSAIHNNHTQTRTSTTQFNRSKMPKIAEPIEPNEWMTTAVVMLLLCRKWPNKYLLLLNCLMHSKLNVHISHSADFNLNVFTWTRVLMAHITANQFDIHNRFRGQIHVLCHTIRNIFWPSHLSLSSLSLTHYVWYMDWMHGTPFIRIYPVWNGTQKKSQSINSSSVQNH